MFEICSRIAGHRVPAAALLALGTAAGTLTACGDAGATITRLTVGSPGPEPYTLMSNTDRQDVTRTPRAGGTRDGDAPGLYGGTRRAGTCDRERLIAFLRAEPEKARAWAKVQGIPVDDIPRYVSRLTPVLLRADTLVTNHGYEKGRATRMTAVLQAGMGVLVNGYGVPTVKCNCGNPLTRPDTKISTGNANYRGRSWPDFRKREVTKIRPRDSRKGTMTSFVLVDPGATRGFERPRATQGHADGPWTPPPVTETAPTSGSPSPGSPSPLDSGQGTPEPGDPSTPPGPEISTSPAEPAEPTESAGPTGLATEPPVTESPQMRTEGVATGGPIPPGSEPPPSYRP
ncbi:DUF6777 domain-containing protein [Spirillospora albida]|uniref:DUF6777 domain-containing protein n=1 Tax=Spirillospora albida TaxID=58123 RepID=UPI000B06CF8E|nr:DUF6777 domain-containing protein [Spirillospora albida]